MKRYTVAGTLGFLVLSALPQLSPVGADSTLYQVTDLGVTTDGRVPSPTGINASGQVSGVVTDSVGVPHAVRYSPNSGWEYLQGLSSEGSFAAAINDLGDVAGYQTVNGVQHAFRYRDGTGVEAIVEFAGAVDSFALGINNTGDVVGYSDTADNTHGWRASLGLPAVQLPDFGGFFALACGINASGQIVATSNLPGASEHGYRINADNTIVDAQSFDGATGASDACAIDEAGNIGGWAQGGANDHAFRFDGVHLQNAEGTLPSVFSSVSSIANHVSVGSYMSTADSANHAFSFTDANGAVDLNTLIPADSGWFLHDAASVNASGQIVGDGQLNNVPRAYILKPLAMTNKAPVITAVTANPTNVSVVNGQLTPVTVTIAATDDSGQAPACAVSSISGPGVSGTDYAVTGPNTGSVKAVGGRTYTFNVSCSDADGNTSASSTEVVVENDTTAPKIGTVTANPPSIPADGQMHSVGVTVPATDDSGVVSCVIASIGGGQAGDTQFTPGSLTGSVKGVAGRTYTFGVQCTDFSGNASASSVAVSVTAGDTTPPVIKSLTVSPDHVWPPNGKMVPVTVTAVATDNVDGAPACALTKVSGFGGSASITGQFTANVRANDDAVYVLTVTCSDLAGNMSSARTTVSVEKPNGNDGPLKLNEKRLAALLALIYDERDPWVACKHDNRRHGRPSNP